MRFESLPSVTASRDRRGLRLYGAVVALVLVSMVLQFFVGDAYETVRLWLMRWAGERRIRAILTGVVVLGALGAVYGAARYYRQDEEGLAPDEFVTLAGAIGLLTVVGAFWLLGSVDVASIPERILGSAVTPVLAMALPAVAFARFVGVRLRLDRPSRDSLVLAVAVVGIAQLVAVGRWGLLAVLEGPASPLGTFRPEYTLLDLGLSVFLPALLTGLGMALVYNAAVQEALRRRLGLAGAVTAVTTIVGLLTGLLPFLVRSREPLVMAGATGGVAFVAVLSGIVVALGARLATTRAGLHYTPAIAGVSGLAVVLSLCLALVLFDPRYLSVASYVAGLATVAAVAAVGYERARSVWLPALGFAAYLVAIDWWVAWQVFSLFG